MSKSSATFFWDNLIPLKPTLYGKTYAGWKPKNENNRQLGCAVLADQRIPVDGNVTLSADVYTPKKAGKYPAILAFSPYCKEMHTAGIPTGTNEVGNPAVFTNRGYCHVIVSGRGMARSAGELSPFFSEQQVDDHEACIAWAAQQEWCDSNVVLFGTSYYGMNQPLVAVRNPPALKAFFCNEICTDYFRHLIQFGGVFNLYFFSLWSGANFTQSILNLRLSPLKRALLARFMTNRLLKPIIRKLVKHKVKDIYTWAMRKAPVKPVRQWLANWMFDGKTRFSTDLPSGPYSDLSKIKVPFVAVQNLGCFNLHQFGTYDLFDNAGTAVDKKWMILAEHEYELPVYDWQMEAVAFFDHILLGKDNGYDQQPNVRYWLDGKDGFRGSANFPPKQKRTERFYLSSRGTDSSRHQLVREPPAGGKNSWAAVPMGVPVLGNAAGIDEVTNQLLSYELVLDEETEFSGAVSARLRFSCNEIDSHVVARLGRVDINSEYHLLSMGTISPARRRPDPARSTACELAIDTQMPEPLIPHEVVSLAFSLTPAPTWLRPGERLRFDIASRADLLRSDVSQGYCHFDLPTPPYFSRNTIHYGPETYVELDKIGSVGPAGREFAIAT